MEIERKFLVDKIPDLTGIKCDEIRQGYFSIMPEKRVRQKGDQFYLTEKGEGDLVREEKEAKIDEMTAKELFERSKTYIIEKTRYYLPYEKYVIELDIYKGRHKGLIVAEVEFDCEQDAREFIAPSWFGKDITCDKTYKNMMLAINKG